MKLSFAIVSLWALLDASSQKVFAQQNTMVKMCLFYQNPSGFARSDPIINQECASDHVHTFYGPQNFHPQTSYEDIRDTPARFSSTPFVENQSLYWHPTFYEVVTNGDGSKTYTRFQGIETSPYYRWDNSALPRTEAFPPGFRMIAHSNDVGANGRMLTECCNMLSGEEESCTEWGDLFFPPNQTCDFLGIALAMPTCWNGQSLGDDNDHKSHMAYTTDGSVKGPCPSGFNRRLPEIQLFVRLNNYDSRNKSYQLSDGSTDVFHVDFFNGWQEGKLQQIIDNCPLDNGDNYGYNPPCQCTPNDEDGTNFLTENTQVAQPVCDVDVRELIIDEATDVTNQLPTGTCQGQPLIPKSWNQLSEDLLDCAPTPGEPSSPAPTNGQTNAPTSRPTSAPFLRSPTPAPTNQQTAEPTLAPTNQQTAEPTPTSEDSCDGDCYECCEDKFYECEEPRDRACNDAFDQCEYNCEEGDHDEECFEECDAAFEQCHHEAIHQCEPIYEECEAECKE